MTLDDIGNAMFDLRLGPLPYIGFGSRSRVSIMLYACRESRGIASKIYSKAFGSNVSPPLTWFDFERDTLYLDWGCIEEKQVGFWLGELSADIRRVENLAVFDAPASSKMLPPDADYTFWIDKVLQSFTNVRRFTIVDRDHDFRESSDLVWAGDTYIDIEESINVFNEPGDFNHVMDILLEEISMVQHWNIYKYRDLTRYNLQIHQYANTYNGLSINYNVPEHINWRTITTRKRKAEYDEAKRRYNVKRSLFKYVLELRCPKQEPSRVAVAGNMSLEEVVERFCKSKNIPFQRDLSRYDLSTGPYFNIDNILESWSIIFDFQFESGAIFHIHLWDSEDP
jgi:hypothetical protein